MLASTDPVAYAVLGVAAIPAVYWLFRKPKLDTPKRRRKHWEKHGGNQYFLPQESRESYRWNTGRNPDRYPPGP